MFATELECFWRFKNQDDAGAKIKLANMVPFLFHYAVRKKYLILKLNWGSLPHPLIRNQFRVKFDANIANIRRTDGGHRE